MSADPSIFRLWLATLAAAAILIGLGGVALLRFLPSGRGLGWWLQGVAGIGLLGYAGWILLSLAAWAVSL